MKNLVNLGNTMRIAFVGIFLVAVSSCSDDFLNISPKGVLDQNTLANEEGIEGLLNGAYNTLNECGAPGGGLRSSKNVLSSMASDEAYVGTLGGGGRTNRYSSYRINSEDPDINDKWIFLYAAVQRTNDVLRQLDLADDISTDKAQQIRAEARFLRGVYHLEAKLLFGNIPYIDETISFAEGNHNVSNEPSAWPKIETDFQYAIDNLNDIKSDEGRANNWAARAYLAKAYMFQAKFSEAQPLLNNIITNGMTASGQSYALYDQYQWNFDYEHRNGPESVFAVQTSVQPSRRLAGSCGKRGNGPYGGSATFYGWLQPSFDFANKFQTEPNTGLPLIETYHETPIKSDMGISSQEPFTPYQGTLDPRIDWTLSRRGIPLLDHGVNPGQAWIRSWTVGGPYSSMKHINWAANPENRSANWTNYPYKLIRFADVLLWAAEVEVEIGSLNKAEMYVNRVRERAANPDGFVKKYLDSNNPQGGFSNEPAANYYIGLYDGQFEQNGQDWAREAVRFERVLELGLEHHRFFDLQRYDLVEDGYMAETLNTYIERTLQVPLLNQPSMVDATFEKDKNETYPIPQPQIDLSIDPETGEPKLIQNPGYN